MVIRTRLSAKLYLAARIVKYYLIFIVTYYYRSKSIKNYDNIKMPNFFSAFCGTHGKPPQNLGVPVNPV
jgi:hypothetical protein